MRSKVLSAAMLACLLAVPAGAQSKSDRQKMTAQSEVTTAESAVAAAQAAGAATMARELYDDAMSRLRQARTNWNSNQKDLREEATLRAVEARYAAAAAEALALLVGTNAEVRNLRTDIGGFGGTASTNATLHEPSGALNRGMNSLDRVIIAENAIKNARAAGAERFAATELERLTGSLKTARSLANDRKQNDNADHLAYIAEMQARRLEYVARLNMVSPMVPQLRAERTRLAQQVADTRAAEEQQRRLEAERQAAVLRQQLDQQSMNRQAEQAELERLRAQVAANEQQFRLRLEEDRAARVRAEEELDDLIVAYEAALQQGTNNAEVERLRRQVEDQQLALRSYQDRERLSETSMGNQIQALEQALERERSEGSLTAQALQDREAELRRQREELARMSTARQEAETARAAAIAEADRRRQVAEAEAAQLRQQVAQTSAALDEARTEIANRDAVAQNRITAMQQELAKLAATRTDERGFIVTLPGLFFDTGKSELKPGARNTLQKIADQLKVTDGTSVVVEGHTDSVGSDELNQRLSEKRAAAVRQYLVSRGVPEARITMTGRGEAAPVASNDTASGRQQNRRVELVISQ